MKKFIKSKKGEGYIDVVIGIFAMMMVLVVVLNIFQFMTLKQDLDEISGQLIETATFNGCFDSEFDEGNYSSFIFLSYIEHHHKNQLKYSYL